MVSTNNIIKLINVKDGDTFGYSLVRLVGITSSSTAATSLLVGCVSQQDKAKSSTTKWPIIRGTLKALVLLAPGSNSVTLGFDKEVANVSLTLTYDPSMINEAADAKETATAKIVRAVYFVPADHDGTFFAMPGTHFLQLKFKIYMV